MRLRSIHMMMIVALATVPAGPVLAQDTGPGAAATPTGTEHADRALLYRLVRQVRRIDRDTDEIMNKAMAEARDNDGKAHPETKAKMLSLRDERDRLFARMLILSMRHGWEIPAFDKPTVQRSSRQEAEHSVFGAADELVKRRFRAEAKRIAEMVWLPVVSLESS